uniref:Sensory neuron membrane protein 2 n=1 Tax=Dendroctonus ponderosae TaxID=77166 RepID=A0AAR5QC97_DENPD
MFRNCCSPRLVFLYNLLAVLLLIASLVLAFWGLPQIISKQIHKQTELTENTDQWDRFKELPFPMEFNIRFFLVTNPADVLNGSMPILKESEPYKYKSTIKRTDIRFDDIEEDSVTYRRSFSFEFDGSGTTREDDSITVINPLLMASFQLTNDIQRLAMAGCRKYILEPAGLDQVFLTTTVRKLLFDGIYFGFQNATGKGVACEMVRKELGKIVANVRVVEHLNDTDCYRLAIFNYKTDNFLKNSPDGIYTINRGRNNATALGSIMRWNGATTSTTYGTSTSINNLTCHSIKGTDSTIYSPELKAGENLMIFNTDLCRTIQLVQVSSNEVFNGINAFRYSTGYTLFRPETILKENDCYCSHGTKGADGKPSCFLDGLLDFRPCLGAPVLISQPHFLHADVKYIRAVSGLSPDEDKHDIYLLLEPNTGTPLEGRKRVQMNSVLRRQPLLSMITPPNMYEAVVPILWLDEGFTLPQKYLDDLNAKYFKTVRIATGFKFGFIAVALALLVGCLFVACRKMYFRNAK